jgi:glycogen operon protein
MLCLLLSGEAGLMHLTERGEKETDDTFLMIVNASHQEVSQRLPAGQQGVYWDTLIDTAREESDDDGERFDPGDEVGLIARSAKLLIQRTDDQGEVVVRASARF